MSSPCAGSDATELANLDDIRAGHEEEVMEAGGDDRRAEDAEEQGADDGEGSAARRGEMLDIPPWEGLQPPPDVVAAHRERWVARELVLSHLHVQRWRDRAAWDASSVRDRIEMALDSVRSTGEDFCGPHGCFTRRRTALDSLTRQFPQLLERLEAV